MSRRLTRSRRPTVPITWSFAESPRSRRTDSRTPGTRLKSSGSMPLRTRLTRAGRAPNAISERPGEQVGLVIVGVHDVDLALVNQPAQRSPDGRIERMTF